MKKSNPKIIVIVGPTSSGKSDLAIKIAKKCNGEIISADSRQVYRGMDIGTGKVSKKEQKVVPHHIIDIASPKKQFTVGRFKKLGQKAINAIRNRGKIPIIVGGTGFYIDVLLGKMNIAEVSPNKKLREKLENLEIGKLFEKLKKLDPEHAKTIEPKNKRRLIRALEIVLTSGKPIPQPVLSIKYQVLSIGLNPENLKERIKKRLDKRLRQGAAKEVKNLRDQGVSWKRLDDFGLEYRWVSRWLKNNPLSAMSNTQFKNSEEYKNLLRDIIKYSKRQMTWFKRNKETHWVQNLKEAEKLTQSFL